MAQHLVVAHQTAASEELRRQLIELASTDRQAEFALLGPATPAGGLLVWAEDSSDDAGRRRAGAAQGISHRLSLDLSAQVRRLAPESAVVHVVSQVPVAPRG